MAKYTFEEKLDIVSQVRKGIPILRISRELHSEGMILEWVRKYELYGESGKKEGDHDCIAFMIHPLPVFYLNITRA